jgi:hypothetical protein
MCAVEVVRRGRVLEVTLNRPKVNAIDRDMSREMGTAFAVLRNDPEAPELTQELRDRMVGGCNAVAGRRHFTELAATRDREIVAVLKAIRETRRA